MTVKKDNPQLQQANPKPIVSIILPVFGDRTTISDCIRSITTQTFDNWELIICAYNISPTVNNIISKWLALDSRIRVLTIKERGIPSALNVGIENSAGSLYIARIDSDDLMLPNRLQKQVKFLEKYSDFSLVGGQRILIDQNNSLIFNRTWYPQSSRKIGSDWQIQSPFAHPAVLVRKVDLIRAGSYRREFVYAEDADLWFRLLEQGKGHNLFSKVIAYRTNSFQAKPSGSPSKTNYWNYIPKICHLLRINGLDENLANLAVNERLWVLNSLSALNGSTSVNSFGKRYIKKVSYEVGLEKRSDFLLLVNSILRAKINWRVMFPLLIVNYLADQFILNVYKRNFQSIS
jgi:glycosyltransferase involved in cell wall biosynthesis